jgi:hypothetical protein
MRSLLVVLALGSLLVVLALGLTACSGPLAEAEAQFTKGQYPGAHQELRELEVESRSWSDASRAEYALYRGLTLVALGDRGRARDWLREAKTAEDERPGSLRYDDARRLAVAIEVNDVP